MSKSVTASAPKIPASQLPTKSAWAKGPPLATASSPRSQSPSSANATQPSTPTHSRKPSGLGGSQVSGAAFKDGVSVPRSIQPTQKPAAGLSFGSIAEPQAPLSSSPASAPPLSSDATSVKSFGSIPATNGVTSKSSLTKPPSKPGTPIASSSPSPTPGGKPKFDVKSLFMNGSGSTSAPSPTASSLPAEGSPVHRPAAIPPNQPPPPQQQQQHAYYQPRTSGPPAPNSATNAANVNANAPRSPQYARQMSNGSSGRGGPPNSAGIGPSSPRMGGVQVQHQQQHPQQHQMPPHGAPHPQHAQPQYPGMPPMHQPWPPQYYYSPYPGTHDPNHYGMPQVFPWQTSLPPQPSMHAPPPHTPGQHAVASPSRPPPPTLHNGGPPPPPSATPTTGNSSPYAAPVPAPPQQYPPFPHSPPPPGTPQTPTTARLSTQAPAFVPKQRGSSAIKIRNPDSGEAVDLATVASPVVGPSDAQSPSPAPVPPALGHARKPTVIRMESEEARKKRVDDEQRAKDKQEKDEQDRVIKRQRDVEEKVRKRKEEEERKRKEVEEEKERKKRDEERRERERKAKEEHEEKERIRLEEERERLRKEEDEQKRREEEEAKELARKAEEEAAAKAKIEQEERLHKETEEKDKAAAAAGSPLPSLTTPKPSSPLPPDPPKLKRPIPGPLDLSATSKPGLPPSLPSALATARAIDNLEKVQYPEGVMSPKPELNAGAANGKFRYDRDFLMQFMAVCRDKPDQLPALDAIGLEPTDQGSGSVGRNRGNSRSHINMPPPSSVPGSRAASVGLGIINGVPGFPMGQFGTSGGKITSEERFAASQMARSASVGGPPGGLAFPSRPTPMVRTASQGGSSMPAQPSTLGPSGRTRSQRGGKRHDSNKVGGIPSMQERERTGSSFGNNNAMMSLEPVEPLRASENRWTPMSTSRRPPAQDPDSPEVVERKVKGLLNKLTMEKFDSISAQIVSWANRSEKEKDGRTLIQVIRLVFEKATDEAAWAEMYARLCRKMMEQISHNVQDDGIRNTDGKPIAGGQLFRKYLLNRCQEDFERGWTVKEASAKAAESKAGDDKAAKDAADKADAAGNATGEEVLYSEEYYTAQKAKRQGLGLVKFIGELFKLQMLTERIMHECIKKLLGNVENPEEEEIESLCKLLSTVGQQLDTPKARSHMDVYFQRMKELAKSPNITSRMQYMLLDVLELRERKWITRTVQAAPTTIAAVHEQAAKDQAKAQIEKDQSVRAMGRDPMSRGGSRRGEHRGAYGAQPGPDGWTSVAAAPPRPPPTAGDLTQFGKISKGSGGPLTFGPSSVFAKKEAKGREASLSRTNSTSNMFAMLNSEAAAEPPASGKSSRPPSRKPSADFSQAGLPEAPQRKKLALLPRTKPVPGDAKVEEESAAPSEASDDEIEPSMTEDQANAKIDEDLKEFWAVRNLEEADSYFPALPAAYKARLVEKLVVSALERKEADAQLVADLFTRVAEKDACPPLSLEEGFTSQIEFIDDMAIDVPAAYKLMAILLKGSKLPKGKVEELASKIAVEGDPAVHPKDKLLREYEKLDSS